MTSLSLRPTLRQGVDVDADLVACLGLLCLLACPLCFLIQAGGVAGTALEFVQVRLEIRARRSRQSWRLEHGAVPPGRCQGDGGGGGQVAVKQCPDHAPVLPRTGGTPFEPLGDCVRGESLFK
jgi:hypothetical protein